MPSSLNIVYPVINVEIAISTMLGTGGNAIISKYLGEEKNERAREALTQFVVLALLLSLVLLLFSELFLTPISRFLGASDVLLADCPPVSWNFHAICTCLYAAGCLSVFSGDCGTPRDLAFCS